MTARERVYRPEEIAEERGGLQAWKVEEGALARHYTTRGWPATLMLVNAIGWICESADHHPDLMVGYNRVSVRLSTHSAGGITAKDLEVARLIEQTALWRPPEGSALRGAPEALVREEE